MNEHFKNLTQKERVRLVALCSPRYAPESLFHQLFGITKASELLEVMKEGLKAEMEKGDMIIDMRTFGGAKFVNGRTICVGCAAVCAMIRLCGAPLRHDPETDYYPGLPDQCVMDNNMIHRHGFESFGFVQDQVLNLREGDRQHLIFAWESMERFFDALRKGDKQQICFCYRVPVNVLCEIMLPCFSGIYRSSDMEKFNQEISVLDEAIKKLKSHGA